MPRVTRGVAHVRSGYKPMPKQAEAHALASKYRSFCGGWGNGKTSWGCAETFLTLHEYPGCRALVARKTRPELKATTWDMLIAGDPGKDGAWGGIPWETVQSYNKSDLEIVFRNGSKVQGVPLDDPRKLENYNLGFWWIDQAEEVEEDILLKLQGRLRQHKGPREGILTWNPHGHNWLWRRFVDSQRSDTWQALYQAVEATTYDNPNLPTDYFEQFEGLPDHWIKRFVIGSHDVFIGQIFPDYDPNLHLIPPFRIPSHWERWWCYDPGMRNEGSINWVARDYNGNRYAYRELLSVDQPAAWWAEKTHEMEAMDDWGGPHESIQRRLVGRETLQRSQVDGRTVLDILHENGLYPEVADRNPAARIAAVTSALRLNEGHAHPTKKFMPAPKFYIFNTPEMQKLKDYLPQYQWKPVRTNFSEEAPPETPRQKDDHNIDNIGHILLAMVGMGELEIPEEWQNKSRQKVLDEHFTQMMDYAQQNGPHNNPYHPLLGAI